MDQNSSTSPQGEKKNRSNTGLLLLVVLLLISNVVMLWMLMQRGKEVELVRFLELTSPDGSGLRYALHNPRPVALRQTSEELRVALLFDLRLPLPAGVIIIIIIITRYQAVRVMYSPHVPRF